MYGEVGRAGFCSNYTNSWSLHFNYNENYSILQDIKNSICVMLTCPCKVHPLTPHFYIVTLGFAGVYIIFLFLLLNIDGGYSLEPPH